MLPCGHICFMIATSPSVCKEQMTDLAEVPHHPSFSP